MAARMSVIISTYNRLAALERAIGSLQRQTRPPDEIVVALWCGDTGTLAWVEALPAPTGGAEGPAPVVPVLVDENTVLAKENAGMRAASGDILCFMDDDAIAYPDWLCRLERLYADPSVGGAGGRDIVWKRGQPSPAEPVGEVGQLRWFGRLIFNHHQIATGACDVDFLKGCNMSFRRDALRLIDRRLIGTTPYGFEIDVGLTARADGWRLVYDPETAVEHHSDTDMSAHNAAMAYVTNHNQTYALLKHLSPPRQLVFLLYTWLIGDRNSIGLLRVPLLVVSERWSAESLSAHFSGKLAGLRSYAIGRWARWRRRRGGG